MKLRTWRERMELTRAQCGDKLDVTGEMIRLYETKGHIPNKATVFRIRDVTAGAVQPGDWYD